MSPFEIEIIKSELSDAKKEIKNLQIELMEANHKLNHSLISKKELTNLKDSTELKKENTSLKIQINEFKETIRQLRVENYNLTRAILPFGKLKTQ